MGEIHELFVLALSLVWFAGATPENRPKYPLLRDVFGDLRATFPADLAWKLLFDVIAFLGFVGYRGFTIALPLKFSTVCILGAL